MTDRNEGKISRQQLETLVNSVNGIVWEANAWTFQFTYVSRQAVALLGYPIEAWLQPDFWRTHIHPDDLQLTVQFCLRCRDDLKDHEFEYRMIAADGRVVWLADKVSVFVENGRPVSLRGIMVDITSLKAAEELLMAGSARHIKQRSAITALIRNPVLRSDDVAAALREITEVSSRTLGIQRVSVWRFSPKRDSIICADLFESSTGLHSSGLELRESQCPAYFRALAEIDVLSAPDARTDPRTCEFSDSYLEALDISSMLDAPIQVEGVLSGVLCHEHVGPQRVWTADEESFVLSVANIVSLVLGQDDRRRLAEQLRQAQKMEAVGQLAGGVAHDFNNILAAIILQAEMVSGSKGLTPEAREYLDDIKMSAERGANLTRQLLAFSRRQVMRPTSLDLNEVVSGVVRMLQRILGEDIRMQLDLHPTPLFISADAGMLDQVLMNLAVNARDAMPRGGRLIIETCEREVGESDVSINVDAPHGRCAILKVSDTGCGIPPDIMPRIFEPFFTTKGQGKGTGLGLATVYGIVKQHRGSIQVRSEQGNGATFEILFPILATAQRSGEVHAGQLPRGGTETILVVEDDSAVRLLTRTILERFGYTILTASHGVEALRLWEGYSGKIDLLFTDMVMPEGIHGRDLAKRLQEKAPHLKVIFTSGYSADIAGREMSLEDGKNFLQKPSSPQQILAAVRNSLDTR